MSDSIILAVDTCCAQASVAILSNHRGLLSHQHLSTEHQQAEQLLPMIEQALRQAEISYKECTHLAVTIGPGSFTGIRIGLSALEGISLALDIPVIGVTTLEAILHYELAQGYKSLDGSVSISLNAGRGQYYRQEFTLGEHISCGQARLVNTEEASISGKLPEARGCASAAIYYLKWGRAYKESAAAVPLYVREPDAVAAKGKSAC
jgi:tRNA threonylcarbamoyladenosine biosynthesis protein TsaB